jgi:hypothetical protein
VPCQLQYFPLANCPGGSMTCPSLKRITLFCSSVSNNLSHLVTSNVDFTSLCLFSQGLARGMSKRVVFLLVNLPLGDAHHTLLLTTGILTDIIHPWFVLDAHISEPAMCLMLFSPILMRNDSLHYLVDIKEILSFHLILRCHRKLCES